MPGTNYLQIFLNASLIIQVMYILLAAMSVICWGLAFAKLMQFRRLLKIVAEDTESLQEAKELQTAFLNLTPTPGAVTRKVAQAGYDEYQELRGLSLPQGERTQIILDNLRHTLRDEVGRQAGKSFRPTAFLGVCANAAPLMGLFGTVWGIFHSFQGFGNMSRAANLMVVGQGLGEALGTTIVGLLVAIPATLFYNYFLSRLGELQRNLTYFAQLLLKLIKADLHQQQVRELQARRTATTLVKSRPAGDS
ncbi:biopolymer transport protein TolQ [Desulfonatronum thiosulfatophilum]|uniref:Biopolymer transport protein TolQ n=1 Tax=Desulfonatronum thiosulfatophilum TaxID=617002 RepID=A0A1G6CHW3_9BACT|nr:MotA/TolQ/ExbB proton channel family protein [Desulfonatronum thiosulfatophilum]SDB32466.1 biopolymer transport protein TolQ [Desulfonatronum thiosulfatophilum]